jgi:hypothetical protein
MNVVVEPARVGAPEGTKCFALAGGLREADATVVVTAVNTGGPYRQHFVIEDARWVFGAPDCIRDANVIEIQTSGLMVEGAKLISVPDNEVAFAFSVESR